MRVVIVCSLALLSGCSLIPTPGESPKRITLASLKSTTTTIASPKQLMVALPSVYPPIDSQRLALRPEKQVLEYYANVEWGDRLSILVQESLVNSLQDSGLFLGVTRTVDGIIPDYTLKIDIRDFNVDKSAGLMVQGEYHLQLVDTLTRQVFAQKTIRSEKPLATESIAHITQSLNEIHLQLTEQILAWLPLQLTKG